MKRSIKALFALFATYTLLLGSSHPVYAKEISPSSELYIYGPGFPEMNSGNEYTAYTLNYDCIMKSLDIHVKDVKSGEIEQTLHFEPESVTYTFTINFHTNGPKYIYSEAYCKGGTSIKLQEPFLSYVGAISTNQVPVSTWWYEYDTECQHAMTQQTPIFISTGQELECLLFIPHSDLFQDSLTLKTTVTKLGSYKKTRYSSILPNNGYWDINWTDRINPLQPGTYTLEATIYNQHNIHFAKRILTLIVSE